MSNSVHVTEPIPRRSKILYVIIMAILIAVAIVFIVFIGIKSSINDDNTTIPQHTNTTNSGTTESTGGDTSNTGTQQDRNIPSSSGSGGNTLLNPDE